MPDRSASRHEPTGCGNFRGVALLPRRQDKTAPNAIEKLEAKLLLEIADLPRQSGLGNVKLERCLGHRTLLGHGDKRSKAPEVHACLYRVGIRK